jgi:hypothetical protein
MTDKENFPGPDTGIAEDLGEPVRELRELEEEVSSGFLGRVLSSLRRRSLTSHIATFSWFALGLAVMEFLRLAFSVFETDEPTNGGSD